MRLGELTDLFARVGCTQLYAKPLAPNDNSKNQVYFGPNFQALNLFHEVRYVDNCRALCAVLLYDIQQEFAVDRVQPFGRFVQYK